MKKKYLSLILACCMIFTVFVPFASASGEDVTLTLADATATYNASESAEGLDAGASTESFILDSKDWIEFDIADLSGTYYVQVKYASKTAKFGNVYLDTLIDGTLTNRDSLPFTYSVEEEETEADKIAFSSYDLYKIYVPSDAETLKLRNSSMKIPVKETEEQVDPQADVESITLIYAGAKDTADKEIVSNSVMNVLNTTIGSGYYINETALLTGSANSYNNIPYIGHNNTSRYTRYDISDLAPGIYDITIDAATYTGLTNDGVSYRPAATINLFLDDAAENATTVPSSYTKQISLSSIYDTTVLSATDALDKGTTAVDGGSIIIGENDNYLTIWQGAVWAIYSDFTLTPSFEKEITLDTVDATYYQAGSTAGETRANVTAETSQATYGRGDAYVDTVVLNMKETAEFDASKIHAGTYSVAAAYKIRNHVNSQVYLDALVDGVVSQRARLITTAGDYKTMQENMLYNIYIPEGTKKLSFKNSSAATTGGATNPLSNIVGIDYIKLTYVGDADTAPKTITSNAMHSVKDMIAGSGVSAASLSGIGLVGGNDSTSNKGYFASNNNVRFARYDVTDFAPGIYTLTAEASAYAETNTLSFYTEIDGVTENTYTLTVPAGSNTTSAAAQASLASVTVGEVTISEDTTDIKIMQTANSIVLTDFTLTWKERLPIEPVTYNAESLKYYQAGSSTSEARELVTDSNYINSVKLMEKETVEIDVSGFASGTYTVSSTYYSRTHYLCQTYLDALVDDVVETRIRVPFAGADYKTSATKDLFTVYIPEGAKTLKLRNSTANILGGVDPLGPILGLKNITLTYVGEDDTADKTITTHALMNAMDRTEDSGINFDGISAGSLSSSNNTVYRTVLNLQSGARWIKYDVKDFAKGIYKVTVKGAGIPVKEGTIPAISIFINDEEVALTSEIKKIDTFSFDNLVYNKAGYINITKDADTLKFTNAVNNAYIEEIIFEKVSGMDAQMFFAKDGGEVSEIGATDTLAPKGFVANAPSDIIFVAASYSGGRLLDCQTSYVAKGDTAAVFTEELNVEGAAVVKLFAWSADGESSIKMIPLSDKIEIE